MSQSRKPYPSDVTDEAWAFVAPHPTPMTPDAPPRRHDLREVFDALRWLVRTGAPWRYLPTTFPPWQAVHQRAQRRIAAGCFEDLAHDLRALPREAAGRAPDPTAAILDGKTPRGTPASGHRAGDDGDKRTKGTGIHATVDTLGRLSALRVTPADARERRRVADPADAAQDTTGDTVELAWADRGYTGEGPAEAAAASGIELVVVGLPAAKRGFVLLPRRWVVERSFAWATRFRRLAKDDEWPPETVAGPHFLAFARPMLHKLPLPASASP